MILPSSRSPSAASRSIEILLVEDSPTDARLVFEVLKEGRIANHVSHVSDGIEAVDFLRRKGTHCNAPRPDIVLLDLNLPRMDGREVLEEIKADPLLKQIPVVALTTSSDEADVVSCYAAGANAYLTKPPEFADFVEVMCSFERFWLDFVTLPSEH
jgi:CheY-like chemotaxis protein